MNRKECYCKKALQEAAGWGTVKKVCNKGKATVGEGFQPSLKVSSFIRKTREKAICPDQSNNSSRSKGGLKTLPYKGVYFFANLKRPAVFRRAFHCYYAYYRSNEPGLAAAAAYRAQPAKPALSAE